MKRLGDCLGGDSMGFSVRYGQGVSEAWKYPRIYAGHRVAKDGRPESDQDTPGGMAQDRLDEASSKHQCQLCECPY